MCLAANMLAILRVAQATQVRGIQIKQFWHNLSDGLSINHEELILFLLKEHSISRGEAYYSLKLC